MGLVPECARRGTVEVRQTDMRTFDEYVGHDLPHVKEIRFPGQEDRSRALAPSQRVAVRSVNRILIVRVADIVRLEADDNYVRLWADRPYLHKETLTGLMARLDPLLFLRIHRSHGVNVGAVRELRPLMHGEYVVVLDDGTELTSGRSHRRAIQTTFGLA